MNDSERRAERAEILKLVRDDIKQAIADGTLPGEMSNYSVSTVSWSQGVHSVTITGRRLHGMWTDCGGTDVAPGRQRCPYFHGGQTHDVLTNEGHRVKQTMEAIPTIHGVLAAA